MVKEFSICDFQKCCEVFIQAFNRAPWDDKWTSKTAQIYLQELVDNRRFLGYTLWDNDLLIGAAFCHMRYNWRGDDITIDVMYISPDYQNKGYGQLLMNSIKLFAKKNSYACIILSTSENTPAFFFYKKTGFTQFGNSVTMYKLMN